jgi:excisionase family DNA binding protein
MPVEYYKQLLLAVKYANVLLPSAALASGSAAPEGRLLGYGARVSVLPDEPFLTVAEVAAILKLNQQTVRNWIDQGRLPAVHIGRRVRIKRSDLEELIEASYSGPRSPEPG